jgi:hypothetical protein
VSIRVLNVVHSFCCGAYLTTTSIPMLVLFQIVGLVGILVICFLEATFSIKYSCLLLIELLVMVMLER